MSAGSVGFGVGSGVGTTVGAGVGHKPGRGVGALEGAGVGDVGALEGAGVGEDVGASAHANVNTLPGSLHRSSSKLGTNPGSQEGMHMAPKAIEALAQSRASSSPITAHGASSQVKLKLPPGESQRTSLGLAR